MNFRVLAQVVFWLLSSSAVLADWRVCFTPDGDCTNLLVEQIGKTQRELLVQAYSFTSPEIIGALVEAKERGIDVRVLVDRSQRDGEAVGALTRAGIPVLIDHVPGIAHNKVMVFDGRRVVTGSFNFTRSAQRRNAENLLVVDDADLAARYLENWHQRERHARPPAER